MLWQRSPSSQRERPFHRNTYYLRAFALRNLFCVAQALDERSAQQEFLRERGVICRALHLLAIFSSRGRVALLHIFLVGDGRGLHVLNRHVAALARIAVERALVLYAAQHSQQVGGEIDRIMNAAVHPHRTDRAVEMRGIASENDAALAKRGSDALMHHVGIIENDVVGLRSRVKALELALAGFDDAIFG